MIVVDTNVIAYLYLPNSQTPTIERLLNVDSDWAAPLLWRSELRNILAFYLRKNLMQVDDALEIQGQAETLLADGEYGVDSDSVLVLAQQSGCTAYDCEFVSLAKSLSTKLVTFDRKLVRTFPGLAVTATDFASS